VRVTTAELKEDFVLFAKYVWYLLDLPQPTRVQLLIAKFMADESNPDFRPSEVWVSPIYVTPMWSGYCGRTLTLSSL